MGEGGLVGGGGVWWGGVWKMGGWGEGEGCRGHFIHLAILHCSLTRPISSDSLQVPCTGSGGAVAPHLLNVHLKRSCYALYLS